MKRYKLTKRDMTTHNGFQWGLNVWKEATGEGVKPCSDAVLHFYHHPLLAVLLNPIHADIVNPRLFEIEIDAEIGTDGLKGWSKKQRMVKELALPKLTTEQRVEFAIRVAMLVTEDAEWLQWANGWLDGADRSEASTRAAHAYAARAAYAADAAYADAARAASVASAAYAAHAAAYAADAALVAYSASAARAAACAAACASNNPEQFNKQLIQIAEAL